MKIIKGLPKNALSMLKLGKYLIIPLVLLLLFASNLSTASNTQLVTELSSIKNVLSQVGPALSAVLFIIAGIFYALGQMLPPDKKAAFHTTAVNIVIGAIVVGALSAASSTLAIASTHLLGNFTAVNGTV